MKHHPTLCHATFNVALALAAMLWFVLGAATAPSIAADAPDADSTHEAHVTRKTLIAFDFTELPPGDPPRELLVLRGDFQIVQDADERYLELPGAPLDNFGVLFGERAIDGLAVEARIRAQSTRRRTPRFGVGLGGLGGYRLRVVPARREIELVLNDEPITATAFKWQSNTWTTLELEIEKTAEITGDIAGESTSNITWTVRGRAWASDQPKPEKWSIIHTTTDPPLPGQASIWGTPYSGKPIDFDDLKVRRVESQSPDDTSANSETSANHTARPTDH